MGRLQTWSNALLVRAIGAMGLNLQGAEVLEVRGRKSGIERSVVVNPLYLDGRVYLMSARGESGWVKNVRATDRVVLRRGRSEVTYLASEITDADEKLTLMRSYLRRWGWQVRSFMKVDRNSSDDEIRAILPKHPTFALTELPGQKESRVINSMVV